MYEGDFTYIHKHYTVTGWSQILSSAYVPDLMHANCFAQWVHWFRIEHLMITSPAYGDGPYAANRYCQEQQYQATVSFQVPHLDLCTLLSISTYKLYLKRHKNNYYPWGRYSWKNLWCRIFLEGRIYSLYVRVWVSIRVYKRPSNRSFGPGALKVNLY